MREPHARAGKQGGRSPALRRPDHSIYGVPSVRISVQSATNLNIGAVYRQGNIYVNVRMLDSPNLTKTIAHELGHYVLGHDSIIPQAVSQAEYQRAQEVRELDANAKAVEILMRVQAQSKRGRQGRRGRVTPFAGRPGAQRTSAHSRPSPRQRGARGSARSLPGRSDRDGRAALALGLRCLDRGSQSGERRVQTLPVRIAALSETVFRRSVQWVQAFRMSPRAAACKPSLSATPTCCITEASR